MLRNVTCTQDFRHITSFSITSSKYQKSIQPIRRKKVYLKVGGQLYETFESTLNRYPNTLLGSQEKRELLQDKDDIIYLPYSSKCFDAILFYYQSDGIMAKPCDVSTSEFLEVCDELHIDETTIKSIKIKEGYFFLQPQNKYQVNTVREKFWAFFEDPAFSSFALTYAFIDIFLIALSIFITCLLSTSNDNYITITESGWAQLETAITTFFGVEFVIKFIITPRRLVFVKDFINIIDFIAIFPYLVMLIASGNNSTNWTFLRAFRVIKVLRLLRFSRQIHNLGTVLSILMNCFKDIMVLLMCLFLTCCISGSLEYHIESQVEGSQFTSIPQAMWWALQTVLCLGYGDIVPSSNLGKVAGMAVAIFGAATITVPLLSLGGRYLSQYTKIFNVDVGPDITTITNFRNSYKHSIVPRKKIIPGFVSSKRSSTSSVDTLVVSNPRSLHTTWLL